MTPYRTMRAANKRIEELENLNGALHALLQESFDHHEYCGWGDTFERHCASLDGLPERMLAVLNE